jgi:hypothetical protein
VRALLRIGDPVPEDPMGIFDGMTSSNFKTAQDGRRLFFPWGYMGRGYVLASEQDGERMRRWLKTYYLAMLAAIVATSGAHAFIVSAAIAGLGVLFHAIWARRQVAGLQPAGETMSFRESSASQARAFGALSLWLLEICSLLFVAAGIFIYIADPTNRPVALLALVFFGCCAAVLGYMLVIRGRTSAAP